MSREWLGRVPFLKLVSLKKDARVSPQSSDRADRVAQVTAGDRKWTLVVASWAKVSPGWVSAVPQQLVAREWAVGDCGWCCRRKQACCIPLSPGADSSWFRMCRFTSAFRAPASVARSKRRSCGSGLFLREGGYEQVRNAWRVNALPDACTNRHPSLTIPNGRLPTIVSNDVRVNSFD